MTNYNVIAGVPIQKWATDPNHEKKVFATYSEIKSKLSKAPTLASKEAAIDYIIQNNPIVRRSGGSPVTGKMILASAQKHGIEPELIMAIAHIDSHYGTQGKGARTKNPGNWGNDDEGNIKTFSTWDEGVDVIGMQLARYRKQVGGAEPTLQKYIEQTTQVYPKRNIEFTGSGQDPIKSNIQTRELLGVNLEQEPIIPSIDYLNYMDSIETPIARRVSTKWIPPTTSSSGIFHSAKFITPK